MNEKIYVKPTILSITVTDYKVIDTIYIFKLNYVANLATVKLSRDLLQISGKVIAILDGPLNQRQL